MHLTSSGYYGDYEKASSVVFELRMPYWSSLASSYGAKYLDYCVFIYEKNSFVNFNDAYNKGYTAGQDYGYSLGYTDGQDVGYNNGYNVGYNAGANGTPFYSLIGAVFDVPVKTFFGLLNFNILGVNVAGFIQALFTISLVTFLLRKIL